MKQYKIPRTNCTNTNMHKKQHRKKNKKVNMDQTKKKIMKKKEENGIRKQKN